MRFLTLKYFNAVAKLGSIRKAADRLHVAPSAVSRQIAQLEHEVDAVLFERSKSGVRLTAAGEVLARHSHRVFRDIERARSGIDDLRGLRRGEVSLWVIEGFVRGCCRASWPNFQIRYPAVAFKVQTASTDRIIEALLEDEADIGITFNASPSRRNRDHRGISRADLLPGHARPQIRRPPAAHAGGDLQGAAGAARPQFRACGNRSSAPSPDTSSRPRCC